MKSSDEVRRWYNTFSSQKKVGSINLRHYKLFNVLVKGGLKRSHKVLEVGCGVGALSFLLTSYLKPGNLLATEISDEAIEIAKKRIPSSRRVRFLHTDMKDFSSPDIYDFILLADVLEHIPVEDHPDLFALFSQHMSEESRLLINIPHPEALKFIQSHSPEKLQIIDQPIASDLLLQNAYASGLELIESRTHTLFHLEPESVLYLFKKANNCHTA